MWLMALISYEWIIALIIAAAILAGILWWIWRSYWRRMEKIAKPQSTRFCTNCGSALTANSKFCNSCGAAQ